MKSSYTRPIIFALIQWVLTTVLQIDRKFFTYDYETKYYVIVKIIYCITLIVAWCYIYNIRRKLVDGNPKYLRGAKIFIIYFMMMMLFLAILWPGTWNWDDIGVLNVIGTYETFYAWQNVLTGLYQAVLLQILPFPGGIILLQNLLISLCVAYIVTTLEIIIGAGYKESYLDILVKIIPFLLPPVLMYQFSGYRIGLYIYIELVFIVRMIDAIRNSESWSWVDIISFAFICVIVSIWRTESFVYIPCACILILYINKNLLAATKKYICIAIIVLGFIGINKWQNSELENNNYKLMSLMCPGAELVRRADYEEDQEALAKIDKVTSVKAIYDNPQLGGEMLYWYGNCVNPDYTEEDYNDYMSAIVSLSLKYPKIVIQERWNMFVKATNLNGETVYNNGTAEIFENDYVNDAQAQAYTHNWIAYRPPFKTARRTLIHIMCCNSNNSGYESSPIQRVIWNAMIPLLILVYAWAKSLIQKTWHMFGICTAVMIKLLMIFLTEPAGWIMYLLSFYLLGYVYLIYSLIAYHSRKN